MRIIYKTGKNISILTTKILLVNEVKTVSLHFFHMFDSCLTMFYCSRWLYLHVHVHFSHSSSSSLLFIFLLRSILFCYIYAHLGPFPIHTFCIRQTMQHKLHSTHMLPKTGKAQNRSGNNKACESLEEHAVLFCFLIYS